MTRIVIGVLVSYLAVCSQARGPAGSISMSAAAESQSPTNSSIEKARLVQHYGRLPLSFEVNAGQADSSVKFLSRASGYGVFLTGREAVLTLPNGGCVELTAVCAHQTSVLRMRLSGASNNASAPEGQEQLPGTANYLVGNDRDKWHTNVPTYAKVRYRNVYPGVDLLYYGTEGGRSQDGGNQDGKQQQLEYDFVVTPGADPNAIRLGFSGAKGLRLDRAGNLIVTIPGGAIAFQKPLVYQTVNGRRRVVQGGFRLAKHTIAFRLASYDHTAPLVIDPVLVYSTYLGGSSSDTATGIATDTAGNVYVIGHAQSADFPVTSGAFQTTNQSCGKPFVTKLNPTGSALIYSTYLGGSGCDSALGLAVDGAGNVYVVGAAISNDFPTTTGAFQTANPGAAAFVTKLNPTGAALLYSTYLGGGASYLGGVSASAVAVDSSGNAYIAGVTDSSTFPVTPGAFQPAAKNNLASNAFVTKLNPAGSALVYSTFLGGSGAGVFSIGPAVIQGDGASGLVVDSAGNAYITGFAYSTDFPVTAGAFQSTNKAAVPPGPGGVFPSYNRSTPFVTKLNATGTALLYSTYLGGSGGNSYNSDTATALAVDGSGNAYVTGRAYSTDFPVTAGAFQPTNRAQANSAFDVFVTKLNSAGTALVYSTYLGGSGVAASGSGNPPASGDGATALAVDGSGNAYIAGSASSANFPVTQGALQAANHSASGSNAFVAQLNPSGNALIYATYLGGSGSDSASGLALDGSGNAYITGNASSLNFPVTAGAFQTANHSANQGSNAFVAKLNLGAISVLPPLAPADGVTEGAGFTSRISAGGIGTIFGTNLATVTTNASSLPLPTILSGTTVTMNGTAVPLFYVSPGQINFQVPWQLLSSSTATLTVTAPGGTSPAITVSLASASPGIFMINTANSATQGAIQFSNTTTFAAPVGALPGNTSRPATSGDLLTIFCSGLGPVSNTPASGSAAGNAGSMSQVQAAVSVTIGGQSAPVSFAGLAPGFVGLYQVNVTFPSGVASGNAVPVVVTTVSLGSNTATIAVQ
jgi:uncharacterized protein (TIGR03437 family)